MIKSGYALIEHCRAMWAPAPLTNSLATSLVPRLAPNRAFALPTVLLGSGYLIIYVLLDWISYVEPYAQFAITPWNPNTGASIALILMFGRRMMPFLFIAPFLADFVLRQ
jgi:hypothetical protein